MSPEGIVIVIGAFTAMIVQIIMAFRTDAKAQKTQEKVKETHDAVNSRMTEFLEKLKEGNESILKSAITNAYDAGLKEGAQANKTGVPPPESPPPPTSPPAL